MSGGADSTKIAGNSNNEGGQIPRGQEHATTSSPLSQFVTSSAVISSPADAVPEVTAATAVEEDDGPSQQPQQTPYEKAVAHANAIQSTLDTLLSQKSQLESSTINEWSTKISNYESQSLREMNDELQLSQNVHANERKMLEEQLRMENELEENNLKKNMEDLREAMDVRRRENKKRCRGNAEEEDQVGSNIKNINKAVEDEVEEGEEKAKMISRSAEKEKELEVRSLCHNYDVIKFICNLQYRLSLRCTYFESLIMPLTSFTFLHTRMPYLPKLLSRCLVLLT